MDMTPRTQPPPAEGMPRWVKVLIAVAVVLVIAIAVMIATGDGGHGPGRHASAATLAPNAIAPQ